MKERKKLMGNNESSAKRKTYSSKSLQKETGEHFTLKQKNTSS